MVTGDLGWIPVDNIMVQYKDGFQMVEVCRSSSLNSGCFLNIPFESAAFSASDSKTTNPNNVEGASMLNHICTYMSTVTSF